MRILSLLALLLLFTPSGNVAAEDQPAKDQPAGGEPAKERPAETPPTGTIIHEQWDRIYVQGGYSGHSHTVVREVVHAGAKQVRTHSRVQLDLTRFGQPTAMLMSSETWETESGTLLRIKKVQKLSTTPTTTVFTFKGTTVTTVTSGVGKDRTTTAEVPADLKGSAYLGRASAELAGSKGTVLHVQTFSGDLNRPAKITVTSKGLETITLRDGQPVELTHLLAMTEGLPHENHSWIDDKGHIEQFSMNMSGMLFESSRVANEAAAKAAEQGDAGKQPDLLEATAIREHDPIPTPRHLERAEMILKRTDGEAVPPDIADVAHTVRKNGDDGIHIVATRAVPPADKLGTRPVATTDALAEALGASSMVQSDAPEIQKTAAEVVGDVTATWTAAQTLERWVFEHMSQKDFSAAFGSALEAYRTKVGDCTEHAVLLAALCRAVGIPTRILMGVVFLHGIWGGHAWNEVYVDGTWYPLDATTGLGFVDPLHVPVARMTLRQSGENEMATALSSIGNMDIDITAVTRNGRSIPVQQSATLVTSENGRYTNRIWSLALDAPAGFTIQLPKPVKSLSAKLVSLETKDADGLTVTIRVDAQSAPRGGFEEMKDEFKIGDLNSQALEVDGRPARTVTRSRNGHALMQTFVVADGATFIFTIHNADHADSKAAFAAVLGGVDFDVK